MKNDSLKEYLETGKIAVAQDAAIMVKTESVPMEDLLKHIAATAMVAKDLHYKAKGKPFLANHELADMIADIEEHKDTINEVYYMGEQQSNPPLSIVICGGAVDIVKGLYGENTAPNENELIGWLHSLCMQDIDLVERVKESGIKAGTQSAVDEISKDAMQYAGFLKNVLSGIGTDVDADSESGTETVVSSTDNETPVHFGTAVSESPDESVAEEEIVSEGDDGEQIDDANMTDAQKYMHIVNGGLYRPDEDNE